MDIHSIAVINEDETLTRKKIVSRNNDRAFRRKNRETRRGMGWNFINGRCAKSECFPVVEPASTVVRN